MTTFNEFQEETEATAVYPDAGEGTLEAVNYTILGLIGEAGSIANKFKKVYRDHDGEITENMVQWLSEELGDVLWYVARTAAELGFDLDTIAIENLTKLERRKREGALHGSGSGR